MINNLNPVVSGSASTDRSQLAEQLARRSDSNRDGQVTSAEFSAFLTGLMQSLDSEHASDAAAGGTAPIRETSETAPVLLPAGDAGTLTRAQGAALLRQAFDTVAKAR